jgi:hypothetical protein
MHVAYGLDGTSDAALRSANVPVELRWAVPLFVSWFDANMIPQPTLTEAN